MNESITNIPVFCLLLAQTIRHIMKHTLILLTALLLAPLGAIHASDTDSAPAVLRCDLAVIGGGSGGFGAALAAARRGRFEARAPSIRSRIFAPFLDRLVVTPVLSADFKSMDQHAWLIDTNVLGGFEWSRTGSRRRFRIMATYFYGHNPYGQFFISQKIESIGLGAYFMF